MPAALGVLVAPEAAFVQAGTSNTRTPDKDSKDLAGIVVTSGISSDDAIMWIVDSNASTCEGRVA